MQPTARDAEGEAPALAGHAGERAGGAGGRTPRVAHVTSVHDATDLRVYHKESRTLAGAGYDVHLVAAAPAAPHETPIACHVFERPAFRSRIWRFVARTFRASRIALRLRADIYHIHDPELLPLAWLLKATGRKVIYDAHEDTPVQALSLNAHRPRWGRVLARASSALEGVSKKILDGFVAATPRIGEHFPPQRTVVVQNFPMLEEFRSHCGEQVSRYAARGNRVIYAGSLFDVRGLRELVGAVERLPERLSPELVIAGRFTSPAFRAELEQMAGWRRVRYLGWLEREDVWRALLTAKVGILTLHPTPAYVDSYPVKLFEYMAAGLPVVASAFPLWQSIVDSAGCGLTVDPLNSEAIAAAIERLFGAPEMAEAMGLRGQRAVQNRYNWSTEASKLLSLYERIAQSGATRA